MRLFRKFWFALFMAAFLWTPSSAQAQVPLRTFSGRPFGNFGAFGNFRNFGTIGGFGFPGAFGWAPGFGFPFAAAPGMYFNTGFTYSTYYRSDPVLIPGFAASEAVRSRTTLYPAIAEPSREVIAAALEGDDNQRARIHLRLPTFGAKVYLDNVLTKQTGLDRDFVTPRLNPGASYAFNARVVWLDANSQVRTITHQVTVRAGQTSSLDLRAGD